MPIYDGVNGVAREVIKKYDGVDGVAREVTKGYVGVDGVARQYWSGEEEIVAWAKYNTIAVPTYTYINDQATGNTNSTQFVAEYVYNTQEHSGNLRISKSYKFNEETGYELTDVEFFPKNEAANLSEEQLIEMHMNTYSYHQSTATDLWQINDVQVIITEENGTTYEGPYTKKVAIALSGTVVRRCEAVKGSDRYEKGESFKGIVVSKRGQLPEEGALIDGSVSGNHCVLEINGTYYYYQRVDQVWNKYSTTEKIKKTYKISYENEDLSNSWHSITYGSEKPGNVYHLYSNYTFNSSTGFDLVYSGQFAFTAETTAEDLSNALVGKYDRMRSTDTHLYKIAQIKNFSKTEYDDTYLEDCSFGFEVWVSAVKIADVTETGVGYLKGETDYGLIGATLGSLPEEGTILEGSIEGDYIILQTSENNIYYYSKLDLSTLVTWKEYNCEIETGYFSYQTENSSFTSNLTNLSSLTLYSGYKFVYGEGFVETGSQVTFVPSATDTASSLNSRLNGLYQVYSNVVLKIGQVTYYDYDENTSKCTLRHYRTRVASSQQTSRYLPTYQTGKTLTVPSDMQPCAGDLVSGGINQNFCVIKVGSQYYYYRKVSKEEN